MYRRLLPLLLLLAPAARGEEELIDFCREHLARFKVPRHVEFRDELPKTFVGKVLRRQLAEEEAASVEQ